MSTEGPKPGHRLAAFFGAYFAYVGLFAPYLSLWLNGRGFSPSEIGVLISPMQWARVVGPPAWGWMADHVRGPAGVARLIQVSALLGVLVQRILDPAGASLDAQRAVLRPIIRGVGRA